jgi:hypothetical protein
MRPDNMPSELTSDQIRENDSLLNMRLILENTLDLNSHLSYRFAKCFVKLTGYRHINTPEEITSFLKFVKVYLDGETLFENDSDYNDLFVCLVLNTIDELKK